MRSKFDRTMRPKGFIRRLKDDLAADLPAETGFHFSAWFFLGAVAMTFLDAYLLQGKGIGHYLSVPTEVLASARSLINV
ncbi:MAG: hypothetical protein HKN28_09710 [Alphaproteobacteria bacterium]|nr:hypothetical protein [Alphaproteobacteria bacterium]